jgi:integrase
MGKLTALQVSRLTKPGLYSDGQGLCLQVTSASARSWCFRFMLNGRARCLGLGSASAISLKRARELVVEPRRQRAEGIDPVEHKRAQRIAAKMTATKTVTFKQCAENYIAAHEHTWVNPVHRKQWRSTLESYVYPTVGALPVQAIDTSLVLKVLQPIWTNTPESASRIRGRIESILDAAKAQELRTGENPARWRGHLNKLLPAPRKVRKIEHHAALPYSALPAFMASLRTHESISARALEFTTLTAARTGEALGARWTDIDIAAKVWTIPATRMKAGKEHKVPLSPRVIEILRDLYGRREGEYVFVGRTDGKPLSNAAMAKMLTLMGQTDITVHGFRSTFRDWAAERTNFESEVVEMALAHAVGSKVEAAYRRGDLFEKRARLMAAWSEYCAQAPTSSVVVPIRK